MQKVGTADKLPVSAMLTKTCSQDSNMSSDNEQAQMTALMGQLKMDSSSPSATPSIASVPSNDATCLANTKSSFPVSNICDLPTELLLKVLAEVPFGAGEQHTNMMLVNKHLYNIIKKHKQVLTNEIARCQFSVPELMFRHPEPKYNFTLEHLRTFKTWDLDTRYIVSVIEGEGRIRGSRLTSISRMVIVCMHFLTMLHEMSFKLLSEVQSSTLAMLLDDSCIRAVRTTSTILCNVLHEELEVTGISGTHILFLGPEAPLALEDIVARVGVSRFAELVKGSIKMPLSETTAELLALFAYHKNYVRRTLDFGLGCAMAGINGFRAFQGGQPVRNDRSTWPSMASVFSNKLLLQAFGGLPDAKLLSNHCKVDRDEMLCSVVDSTRYLDAEISTSDVQKVFDYDWDEFVDRSVKSQEPSTLKQFDSPTKSWTQAVKMAAALSSYKRSEAFMKVKPIGFEGGITPHAFFLGLAKHLGPSITDNRPDQLDKLINDLDEYMRTAAVST